MRLGKLIPLYILGMFSIFFVSTLHASTITPSAGQNDDIEFFTLTHNEDDDFLKIRPANASGISVNKFDTFSVTADKPLKILNTKNLGEGDELIQPAKLIIIESDSISILGAIEIVGPLVDLLFISTSSDGLISCAECSVENVYRASFAVAEMVNNENQPLFVNTDIQSVGRLKSTVNGQVTISGFESGGLLGVEIIANRLDHSGVTLTHLNGFSNGDGEYDLDPNGDKSIGSTVVSAALGDVVWDYNTQNLLEINSGAGSSRFEGSIEAVAVKIWASYPLTVNTAIDTRTDLLSSIRYAQWDDSISAYRDTLHIAKENISINTFNKSSDMLTNQTKLLGSLKSNNDISIRSLGRTVLSSTAIIDAPAVNILSGKEVFNSGDIKGDFLKIAGSDVYNFGKVSALQAELYTEKSLFNHFGGHIVANDLSLQSELGVVRNGSRTPYIPAPDDVSNILTIGYSDLILSDLAKVGTFYKEGVNIDLSDTGLAKPEVLAAKIIANNLYIKAPAFENINPYWVEVQNNILKKENAVEDVEFDFSELTSVSIHGLNSIQLDVEKYTLNSSANLISHGDITINSSNVINERYRVLSTLQEKTSVNPNFKFLGDTEGYRSEVKAYSPPGLIASLGDLNVVAEAGFSNKASYVDVYGDANFWASSLYFYGVSSGAYYQEYGQEVLEGPDCLDLPETQGLCVGAIGISVINKQFKVDPSKLDSLFSVGGNAYGRKFTLDGNGQVVEGEPLDFVVLSLDSFQQYVNEMIEDIFSIDAYAGYNETNNINPDGNTITTTQKLNNYNHCDLNKKKYIPIDVGGITTFIPILDCEPVVETIVQVYSLMDELERYYEKIKSVIASWMEDLGWWGE